MSPTRERLPSVAALGSASGPGTHPFSIDAEFDDSVTSGQRNAFRIAAKRWLRVIAAGGPPVEVEGETIDALVILVKCASLDRKGGLTADTQINLRALRGRETGTAAGLPAKATITLDVEDMGRLENAASGMLGSESIVSVDDVGRFLVDLIAHEIGHALGFSRDVWVSKGLLKRDLDMGRLLFTGRKAASAYGSALGTGSTDVPLEVYGDREEFIAHWRQAIFHSELMTFMLEDARNNIGPVTVGALEDLGYRVDPNAVETRDVDFVGASPADPPSTDPVAGRLRLLLRDYRWINCRVRAG